MCWGWETIRGTSPHANFDKLRFGVYSLHFHSEDAFETRRRERSRGLLPFPTVLPLVTYIWNAYVIYFGSLWTPKTTQSICNLIFTLPHPSKRGKVLQSLGWALSFTEVKILGPFDCVRSCQGADLSFKGEALSVSRNKGSRQVKIWGQ